MLKALTMFTMEYQRQGEGVITLVAFYSPENLKGIQTRYTWPHECMKLGLMCRRRGYHFILDRQPNKNFPDNFKNCGEIDGQDIR